MTRRVLRAGTAYDYMEWEELGTTFFRRSFFSAQECADWIAEFRPAETVEWRVIGTN